jgi:Ca2+-binding EF-hand superfamily protein
MESNAKERKPSSLQPLTKKKLNTQDEDPLKIFFDTHGLTEKDIDIAFELLSKDKKKIYHSDIKTFIATYFDHFPDEAMSLLNGWKEEVTKEQLIGLLLNRNLMSSPYETAYKWFSPENGVLGKKELKGLAKRMNKYKLPNKRDTRNLLNAFDLDRDGVLGLEDFKRMGLGLGL